MFHLIAFSTAGGAGALDLALDPVPDRTVTFGGTQFFMPEKLPGILGGMIVDSQGRITEGRLSSPNIDRLGGYVLQPLDIDASVNFPWMQNWKHKNPVILEKDEGLSAKIIAAAGTANIMTGFVWLSDGPLQEVDGQVYTVKVTSTITGTANTWTQGELTFIDPLPSGRFQCVGLQTVDANAAASRVIFSESVYYPGLPGLASLSDPFYWNWMRGCAGVWGEFTNRTLPYIEILGAVTGTQEHYMDLIWLGPL